MTKHKYRQQNIILKIYFLKNLYLDVYFRQITTYKKFYVAFAFGVQSIDFSKIFQLKGLKPKNKGYTNFYECCDLMKKVYLMYDTYKRTTHIIRGALIWHWFSVVVFDQKSSNEVHMSVYFDKESFENGWIDFRESND